MENKHENSGRNHPERNSDDQFIIIRDEMKAFLAERKLYPLIAIKLNISVNTVRRTFELSTSEKDLKGNRWQVWNAAIDLIYEVKTLSLRAERVLNM